MRSLIIEDEALARSRLKRLLLCCPDVSVVGEAEDGARGLELILRDRPDLIFLDIEMPRLNGFEMLSALPKAHPLPIVVFVTSFDHYALKAFQANALGYLLKPIEEWRLLFVLDRVRGLLREPDGLDTEQKRVLDVVRRTSRRRDHVVGRRGDRFILLRTSEILLFTTNQGGVEAETTGGRFQIQMTLDELDELLSGQRFFRARRSALVNLGHVREMVPSARSTYTLFLTDAGRTQVEVSERRAKYLREMLVGL